MDSTDAPSRTGYTRARALASVGAGWAPLIHFLFDRIERPTTRDDSAPLSVRVVQVKEKFGGLRFYYDWLTTPDDDHGETAELEESVRSAEALSYYLCERCGASGRPRTDGWIRTRCDTHAADRLAPRA